MEIPKPNGGTITVQPVCECHSALNKQKQEEFEKYQDKKDVEKLFSISDVGEKYSNARFEDFNILPGTEQSFKVTKYCAERFEELGQISALLYGGVGNGKTTLAACLHNYLVGKGKIVVFVSMTDLLDRIRNTFNKNNNESEEQILKALFTCDLLIIDDIGAEKTTDWVTEKIFTIIDGRYRRKKPIFATSNLKPQELPLKIGERSTDRLLEMSQPIENKGKSVRKQIAVNRISMFDNI